MKEKLRELIQALVEKPDEVEVEEVSGSRTTIFEVRVAPSDVGRVIGREGRVVKSLRTILRAIWSRERREGRVDLEVLD